MKGIIVAGTHSGCGKTTITLGLMAAFRRRGLSVAPFKVGPDFIDPGHHTRVTGRQSRNLDGWMLSPDVNREIFHRHASRADIAVVEGVMGLFDGHDGEMEAGSTAQMAKWLGLPVLLVVDAQSMARSAAALVQGFANFDPELTFAGVLFNRIGSPAHLKSLKHALALTDSPPCRGGVGRHEDIAIPERHLGLVTVEDHGMAPRLVDNLADMMEQGMDMDAFLDVLPEIRMAQPAVAPHVPATVRIAVARDRAFCFYYPENLEMLEACGAELVRFSPLKDAGLPENIDGIYLGGGYPELHAAVLSGKTGLRNQIFKKCREGMPIYGECGGFMMLCKTLVDIAGKPHPMAGCFDLTCRMASRRAALGYREIVLRRETLIGGPGDTARGHEFHYSHLESHEGESVYGARDRSGETRGVMGFQVHRCLGSYLHLHFMSQPRIPRHFVRACRDYRKERSMGHGPQ